VIHVVAHEYGHQRAGLTDNVGAYTSLYHTGPVPSGRQDVMTYDLSEARGHTDVVFDSRGNESAGDNTTCRGNLLTNRLH
jgi:hypothetical protein